MWHCHILFPFLPQQLFQKPEIRPFFNKSVWQKESFYVAEPHTIRNSLIRYPYQLYFCIKKHDAVLKTSCLTPRLQNFYSFQPLHTWHTGLTRSSLCTHGTPALLVPAFAHVDPSNKTLCVLFEFFGCQPYRAVVTSCSRVNDIKTPDRLV